MNCEIITIGDELLIGQVIDTNSAWMARELNPMGIAVRQITSVSDKEEHIVSALELASKTASVIIMTGGLGPTKDDLTKNTLCRYFNSELRFDEDVYGDVKKLFAERGFEVTETNRQQAMVPVAAQVLRNQRGTAPGMWFEKNGVIYVSLPGVPYEMKHLMENEVLPRLRKSFDLPPVMHKTLLTQGIGESTLSDKISSWESALPKDLKLAYLPSPGMVRLRLSLVGANAVTRKMLEQETEKLRALIATNYFGEDEDTLEKVVGNILKERNETMATAESCTGGHLAAKITKMPGASQFYKGSIIAYANEIKKQLLNVSADTLEKHGAVSEETVVAMVESLLRVMQVEGGIATSGIAGPDGGSEEKPVGLVWIAAAYKEKTLTKKFLLGSNRERTIEVASQHGLFMLRKLMLESNA
jgi:nicotinamide-nucleotide amidase